MNAIKENLAAIRKRIAAAAGRAGRDPEDIRLVAVSKRIELEKIVKAAECGQLFFGENFVQEAVDKIEKLAGTEYGDGLQWHFIGHLQSNKAKIAADNFQTLETIDRLKIAKKVNSHLRERGRHIQIFVQVNIGREPQKSGVLPEDCQELLLSLADQCPCLEVRGLMTMPPFHADPEAVRPYFKKMRLLAEQLREKGLFQHQEQVELSMGMSEDFEVAIEEGATLVRVGTAIFGPRECGLT